MHESALARAVVHAPDVGRRSSDGLVGSLLGALTPPLCVPDCCCQDAYREPTKLPCSHIFCNDCLSEWFERERTCPM